MSLEAVKKFIQEKKKNKPSNAHAVVEGVPPTETKNDEVEDSPFTDVGWSNKDMVEGTGKGAIIDPDRYLPTF